MISIAILVGGKGTRVKSITKGKSKAEIKLDKKNKIIDYQLTALTKLKKKIYIISNKSFLATTFKAFCFNLYVIPQRNRREILANLAD